MHEEDTTLHVAQEVEHALKLSLGRLHRSDSRTLFERHAANPLLTAANWPYPCNSVFNPGAIRLKDGMTLLLCRVEDHRGHSHFCTARSANGVDGWEIGKKPCMTPDPRGFP